MFITNWILFAKCGECFKFAISNAASKLTNTDNFQRNDSNFLSFPISKQGEIISKQKERRERLKM
jgi:hypothetical protein